MGEPDKRGSYLKISVTQPKDSKADHYLISLGGAELLADEIAGALQ
jgi:hypothetical protein